MPAKPQMLPVSRLSRLRREEFVERHLLRLIFLGLVVLSLAGLLYLTQASAVTKTYYEIQDLLEEKEHKLRRRDELREDIAELTEPESVAQRARERGFRPAGPPELVAVPKIPVVAQQPLDASPSESSSATAERLLTQASNWLQTAISLLPAPQQVEAGSVNQ